MHGGGILLYVKDSLPFSIIISGPESFVLKFMIVLTLVTYA